jgi:hypothetical protein
MAPRWAGGRLPLRRRRRSSEAGRRSHGRIAVLANGALQEVQEGNPSDQEQEDCESQDESKQLIRHFSILRMHRGGKGGGLSCPLLTRSEKQLQTGHRDRFLVCREKTPKTVDRAALLRRRRGIVRTPRDITRESAIASFQSGETGDARDHCVRSPAYRRLGARRLISTASRKLTGGYRANKSTMAIVNSPVAAINTLWPQRAIRPSIISIS